jgi:hypothetical protein
MAAPRIKVDERKFRRKMQEYEKLVGKEVKQLVHNTARVCAVELAKVSQPYGTKANAKEAGENAVAGDLKNIFTAVLPEWWDLILSLKPGQSLKSKGAEWAKADQQKIASAAEAVAHHKRYRNRRGRTKDLGELSRAIVKSAVLKKLRKELMKKVGLAKAGWGVAATLCKADVREPLRGIPGWVRRNIGRAKGFVDDSKAGNGFSWKVKIGSRVPYARSVLTKSNEQIAIATAKKKMISMMNHAIRFVKAKQAGLKQ